MTKSSKSVVYLSAFNMPRPVKISARSSTITNSFANSIIPTVQPSEDEVRTVFHILKIEPSDVRCAYCGDCSTEWDHFRPVVSEQRPTGYISEIRNLVPACGKCNQPKGNQHWETWMKSGAKQSPSGRSIADIEERIIRLREFEKWGNVQKVDFEALCDSSLWDDHWKQWKEVLEAMKTAQGVADRLRAQILDKYQRGNESSE